jgi:hypothetical protein
MKDIYIRNFSYIEPAAPVHYLYGEKVQPGQLLEIRNIVGRYSGQATTELTGFGVRDMSLYYPLGEDMPLVTGGYPMWKGKVVIGEGLIPCTYFPSSAQDDVLIMTIYGFLYDQDCWQYEHSLLLLANK